MISFDTKYGTVVLTGNYFAEMVVGITQSSFGVAGMAVADAADSIKSLVFADFPEKGVRVTEEDGQLIIRLHIKVTYGVNIPSASRSISHKVSYVVEEATGLKVRRVDVVVDGVIE